MASDAPTFYTYPTAFGPITIGSIADTVTSVSLGTAPMPGRKRPTAAANQCATEIMEYLAGKRSAFTVACAPDGTPFQRRVWDACARIPYGQVRTTRELAETLGAPESYRAVGAALRACPIPLLVPVHRVVTSAGKPTSDVNAALLKIEQRPSSR